MKMGIFNFKANKQKKLKCQLIERVQEVERVVVNARLFQISNNLNKIINMLDDPKLNIELEQVNRIMTELKMIEEYAKKGFEELLISKCKNIISIIERKTYEHGSSSNSNGNNDDKINILIGEQKEIIEEIKILDKQMAEVLGKDKQMWLLYNNQKKIKCDRLAIIAKTYDTYLKAHHNQIVAEEIKKAKAMADEILNSSVQVDAVEVEADAEYVSGVSETINETSEQIGDTFVKHFGGSNDDDYERAMEENSLNEMSEEHSSNDSNEEVN